MVIYASILLNMIMFQPNPQKVINLHGYHKTKLSTTRHLKIINPHQYRTDMTISINQDPSLVAHHSVGKLTKEPTQLSNQETMNLSMHLPTQ